MRDPIALSGLGILALCSSSCAFAGGQADTIQLLDLARDECALLSSSESLAEYRAKSEWTAVNKEWPDVTESGESYASYRAFGSDSVGFEVGSNTYFVMDIGRYRLNLVGHLKNRDRFKSKYNSDPKELYCEVYVSGIRPEIDDDEVIRWAGRDPKPNLESSKSGFTLEAVRVPPVGTSEVPKSTEGRRNPYLEYQRNAAELEAKSATMTWEPGLSDGSIRTWFAIKPPRDELSYEESNYYFPGLLFVDISRTTFEPKPRKKEVNH